MMIDPAWGWAVLLGVLGLVFGSFIATNPLTSVNRPQATNTERRSK